MSSSFFPKRVAEQHNPIPGRSSYEAHQKAAIRLTSPHAWLIILAIVFALLVAACGPERLIGFQGYLTNNSGTSIIGTRNFVFRYFSDPKYCAGGSTPDPTKAVFTETQNNVQVINGLFNVAIGATSTTPERLAGVDPAVFARPLWLEIEVDGEALQPCQKVLGAPYALSLAGGAVVGISTEGNGPGGSDDTTADYGALSVVNSGNGTALVLGVTGTGDLIRACSAAVNARSCTDLEFRITSAGEVYADGTYHTPAADFAELIRAASPQARYQPGDVLAISPAVDRAVTLADQPYSTAVIGVVSTKPGFLGRPAGVEIESVESAEGQMVPVAIVGIVPVKVTAENGAIHRGDLLTTASKPGYAMKATRQIPGTILGKAMGELLSGEGVIEVFLMLR